MKTERQMRHRCDTYQPGKEKKQERKIKEEHVAEKLRGTRSTDRIILRTDGERSTCKRDSVGGLSLMACQLKEEQRALVLSRG